MNVVKDVACAFLALVFVTSVAVMFERLGLFEIKGVVRWVLLILNVWVTQIVFSQRRNARRNCRGNGGALSRCNHGAASMSAAAITPEPVELNVPLRRRGEALEAATVHMSHGERSLQIVGLAHIAEQAFWDEISVLIDQTRRAGGVVQSEGLIGGKSTRFTRFLARRGEGALARAALVSQSSALPYDDDTMTPTDLTWDVFRAECGILRTYVLLSLMLLGPFLVPSISRETMADVLLRVVAKSDGARLEAVNRLREQVAIAAIRSSSARRIISLWGAAHLPRLVRALEDDQWSLDRVHWRPVLSRITED